MVKGLPIIAAHREPQGQWFGELPRAEIGAETQFINHSMPSMLGGQYVSCDIVKCTTSLGCIEVGPEKRELEVQLPEGVTFRLVSMSNENAPKPC